jgi:uncharacterized protein
MKRLSKILSAASLAVGLALAGVPAGAQQPAAPPLKPASPAAIAAAKEILAMKNASAMYANAVPNIVQQTKDALLQSNLNYQKDLNEVAVVVAQKLAGREKEIGEGMAKVYANEFSEQELKDLVTFYKSPLGQNSVQHVLYESVGAAICRNRQWRIPRRDAQARQGDMIPELGLDRNLDG